MDYNYGFVYCLSNQCMPGICKIGQTIEKTSHERAKELSASTSFPMPFEVIFYIQVRNPLKYEKMIHDKLKNFRVNKKREFFTGEPHQFIKYFKKENLVSKKYFEDFPNQYLTICKSSEIDLNIFENGEIDSIDGIEIDISIITNTNNNNNDDNTNITNNIQNNLDNISLQQTKKISHKKKLSYKCTYCPYITDRKSNLLYHITKGKNCDTKNNKQYAYLDLYMEYICKLCNNITETEVGAKYHLKYSCKVMKENMKIIEYNNKKQEIDNIKKNLEQKEQELLKLEIMEKADNKK